MKLALGTVQFGLPYGVANRTGCMPIEEATAVIRTAESHGLTLLDTAIGYGNSEVRLGEIGVGGWQVVTKLPAFPDAAVDASAWVESAVRGSLERVGLRRLYGLMVHRAADLSGPRAGELFLAMTRCRDQGLVEKIGVSVYAPDELDELMARFALDLVQLPYNLLDRRFAESGALARLEDAGIEVHSRSAFLQGLLLMAKSERPAMFSRWNDLFDRYDAWLRNSGLTAVEACLRHALAVPGIDRVLVGVDSAAHLSEILLAGNGLPGDTPPDLASQDEDLVNPSRWRH